MNDGSGKINFEWDPQKAAANVRKHRVTFDEAETVFADRRSLDIFDPDHSRDEDRYVKLGMSQFGRVLVVIYTERETQLRLISARRANRYEKEIYSEDS